MKFVVFLVFLALLVQGSALFQDCSNSLFCEMIVRNVVGKMSFEDKLKSYLIKTGFKLIVSQQYFWKQIPKIGEKIIQRGASKTIAKKIPIFGAIAGVGLGVWRLCSGQYYRAGAQVVSGLVGATGVGIAGSIAIDTGILIADIIVQLQEKRFIEKRLHGRN